MSSSDFLTKISGGPCGPVFKGQESHFAVETWNQASINRVMLTKQMFNLPIIIWVIDIKDCDFGVAFSTLRG